MSLSAFYNDNGLTSEAAAVIQRGIDVIPEFTAAGQCYIKSIESGKDPRSECGRN